MNFVPRLCVTILIYLCAINLVCARWFPWEEDTNVESVNRKYHVDYFVLAMEWPEGTCEYINSTHKHTCVISDKVNGWVLHGLWPSSFDHKFLQYCNHSSKFDFHKIENMRADLLKYWPNLFKDSSKYFLWKHEYEKHGTCAALVPGYETEKEYFSNAMKLLHNFDPARLLAEKKIVPREDSYDSEVVINAFKSQLGDGVCTQCSRYGTHDTQVLTGLEICLSKDLKVITCPHCGSKYNCDGDVYYHPLNFNGSKLLH